jgi:hypothetical protein
VLLVDSLIALGDSCAVIRTFLVNVLRVRAKNTRDRIVALLVASG